MAISDATVESKVRPQGNLTSRQSETLAAIRSFSTEEGFPPTRADLGKRLGVSPQTADFHLRALERKGKVRLGRGARSILLEGGAENLFTEEKSIRMIPLLGKVAAGVPLMALENRDGDIALPQSSAANFALRVQGDSMIEAGIFDKDTVLVEGVKEASSGDVVVAMVGEGETAEVTVKRWFPDERQIILRPANASHADIVVPKGSPIALVGRVVGVLRMWS